MFNFFHIFSSNYSRYEDSLWNRQANSSMYNPYNINIGSTSSISTRHGFSSHGHSHAQLFPWNKTLQIEKKPQHFHNQRFWSTQIGTSSTKQNLLMTLPIDRERDRRREQEIIKLQMRTNNFLSSREKGCTTEAETTTTTITTNAPNKRKIQDSEITLDLNLSLKIKREDDNHQKRLKAEEVGNLLSLSLFSSSTTSMDDQENHGGEKNTRMASTLDLTL